MDNELAARRAARDRLARLERAREELPGFCRKQGYSEEEIQREIEKLEEIMEVEEETLNR